MNEKNKQQDILDNDLGSREEIEVRNQRIKELEQHYAKDKKRLKDNIVIFSTLLITVLTISIYTIKHINVKRECKCSGNA